LLCYGWSPKVLDNLGNTPLHSAVASNNFEVCLALLDEIGGLNPNKNKEGYTPLGLAKIGSDIHELLSDECSPQTHFLIDARNKVITEKEKKNEEKLEKTSESYRKKRIEESKKKIGKRKRKSRRVKRRF
jgi:ankyrin repeat protein